MEEELLPYNRVLAFLAQYGHLPSLDTLRAEGIRLFPTAEPVPVVVDRLVQRACYALVRSHWGAMQTAMSNNDQDAVTRIVAEVNQQLQVGRVLDQVVDLHEAFALVLEEADQARENDGLTGATLGWPVLDQVTHGAAPGDLITIVARPQIGKSWTMLKMALSCWEAGHSVFFVSMEMTNVQTARRGLAMMANISPNALATGGLDARSIESAARTIDIARNSPVPFRLLAGDIKKSVDDIDALTAEFEPGIVFIDASYLLRPPVRGNGGGKRWEAASEVAEEIKSMAIKRNVPVVQSVQFNRSASKDERGGGLEYIGQTDAIGQLSSVVIGVAEGREPNEENERVYTIYKNRNGPCGKFAVSFEFTPSPTLAYKPISQGGISVENGGIDLPDVTWGMPGEEHNGF